LHGAGSRPFGDLQLRERRPRASRKPEPTDVVVGHNIRILRLERKMSQSELAERLGVTFQQVQKYEHGTNRVGGGRLHRIADAFGVPLKELFRGAPEGHEAPAGPSPLRFLAQPQALRLVKAFDRIEHPRLRRVLVGVVEMVAPPAPQPERRRRAPGAKQGAG
jgi:transcriptional regulator with XRE-family HTH domain